MIRIIANNAQANNATRFAQHFGRLIVVEAGNFGAVDGDNAIARLETAVGSGGRAGIDFVNDDTAEYGLTAARN